MTKEVYRSARGKPVDTLRANNMIWGVGRGSSVASYVLYLLGVHRIDSLFYQLDAKEFLR